MTFPDRTNSARRRSRVLVLLGAILAIALLSAAHASASAFEQPPAPGGIFGGVLVPPPEGVFPEEAQLGGLSDMAINVNGNGGVPAGTVYAVMKGESGVGSHVARYTPSGSGLAFSLAWQAGVLGQPEPYERCGPDAGEPLHPHCPARPDGAKSSLGVAVDQTTGNVYVLNEAEVKAGSPRITEYSPDGKSIITRFGEHAAAGKTTTETPGEIHSASNLAVNAAGEVFVFDVDQALYFRLMVFKPQSPGDYEHYVYAGQEHDVATGIVGQGIPIPQRPVLDDAGNIYVTNETHIQEYEPGKPEEPICDFVHAAGGIVALAVNPQTGEPFYYTYKDNHLHQLSACKEGKFIETSEFARTQAANRGDISALAFDPLRKIGTRPAGALYGGVPDSGDEPGTGAIGYIFAPAEENAPAIESESVAKVTSSSAQLRAQINPKGFEARYLFQYLPESVYGENTHSQRVLVTASGGTFTLSFAGKATAPLPFDAAAGEVAAALEALSSVGPGNVAVQGGPGDPGGTSPYQLSFGEQLGEVLAAISADGSGLSGIKASAAVRNEFFVGAAEAPLGGAVLGSGQSALSAAAAISGLTPDTAYRYRALASSHCSPDDEEKLCEETGAGQSFHTFAVKAPGLADNRAWELVSPADKHGGQVLPADPGINTCGPIECKPGGGYTHFPMQSAPDGEAIVYEGNPFSPVEGSVSENQYISQRDPSTGWETTDLSPALASKGSGQGYNAFNAALTEGIFKQISPTLDPDAPSEYANLYLQPTGAPSSLDPLLKSQPPNRFPGIGSGHLSLTYGGASADFSRQFFEANDALTEATPFAPAAVDGGASKNNLYEWSGGLLRLVNVSSDNTETAPGAAFGARQEDVYTPANLFHAFSEDGSRVFWSDEAGQLYVRENGETTKAIPDPGKFQAASADGSKVLLSSGQIFDLETEATTDLTQSQGGFEGILGQSEDLSHLYFVDTAVLDETPNGQGALAKSGQNNLYAWHEGSSAFVATMGAAQSRDWASSPSVRTAEASPNGRWLTFLSRAPLTGYDNTGLCDFDGFKGKFVESPCEEVFLYDSATGELRCSSCNPSGERPLGHSTLRRIYAAPGSLPQPRYLTDAGRLYFDSRDSLVPSDTNEGVEDVYQYEPEGIGGCKRAGGCVDLISAGHEAIDSNFLAIDETGKNVFFTTRDQLAQKDRDQLIDLYDAREGGGIPAETEVGRGECQGESCQPPLTPPDHPTPASASLAGEGNVEVGTRPCHKRKVRKHGKCVKKHHKSHKRHQKPAAGQTGGTHR